MRRVLPFAALALTICGGPREAPLAEAPSPDGRHVARTYAVSLPEAYLYRAAIAPVGEAFRPGSVAGPGPRDVIEARGAPGPQLAWAGLGVLLVHLPAGADVRELGQAPAAVRVHLVHAGSGRPDHRPGTLGGCRAPVPAHARRRRVYGRLRASPRGA